MFDRIVLGRIRRVVSHPDFYVDLVDKFLQVLLEQVLARIVAATTVAQQEEGGGVGPGRSPMSLPPLANAVACERAGVMTHPQIHVAAIAGHIVEPVGDDHP